jgi:hypothetical protein
LDLLRAVSIQTTAFDGVAASVEAARDFLRKLYSNHSVELKESI